MMFRSLLHDNAARRQSAVRERGWNLDAGEEEGQEEGEEESEEVVFMYSASHFVWTGRGRGKCPRRLSESYIIVVTSMHPILERG